jgi:hypothetical protein
VRPGFSCLSQNGRIILDTGGVEKHSHYEKEFWRKRRSGNPRLTAG